MAVGAVLVNVCCCWCSTLISSHQIQFSSHLVAGSMIKTVMTKRNERNKPKRQLSDSPNGAVATGSTAKQHCGDPDSLGGETDSDVEEELSLKDLYRLIKREIAKANDDMKTRLNGMASEINDSVSQLKADVESIKLSQEFLSGEFDRLKADITNNKSTIASLTKNVTSINGICTTNEKHIEELNYELNSLRQTTMEGHLLICNVIRTTDEKLEDVFNNILTQLNVQCRPEDVQGIARLSSSNKGGLQPILVRFSNSGIKERIIRAARDNPISCDTIGLGVKQRIYFNHRLTNANRFLLNEARKFKRIHNFKFVWYSNGEIFLRKDETSKAIRVSDVSVLSSIV